MPSDTPLILFSGMGADARVFAPQKRAFPDLIVPDWPAPVNRENLATYCERLAKLIDPGRPCVIGGASFGGIIALEVARYLDPLAVIITGGGHVISLTHAEQVNQFIRDSLHRIKTL